MRSSVRLIACLVMMIACSALLLARGEIAPPPYGAGLGNAGDWMPGGSLFGFDDPFGDGGVDGGGHGYGGFGWGFGGGSGRRDRDRLPNGGFNWNGILGGGGGGSGGGEGGGAGGGGPILDSPCASCLEEYCDYDEPTPGAGPVVRWRNTCFCRTRVPATARIGDPVSGKCARFGSSVGQNGGCCIPQQECTGIVGQ